MAIYIIQTAEIVKSTYAVEASSAELAEAKFGNPQTDWNGVELLGEDRKFIAVQETK